MRSGHRVIEVSPEKEVVWSVGQYELPGIQLSWVATCTERPNGNIVISNCFAVNTAACKRSSLGWTAFSRHEAVLQGNAPPGSGRSAVRVEDGGQVRHSLLSSSLQCTLYN